MTATTFDVQLNITDSAGRNLHAIQHQALSTLDADERVRLLTARALDPNSDTVVSCSCGWLDFVCSSDRLPALVAHCARDTGLPVFRVSAFRQIGSRTDQTDRYATAVDDATGHLAVAVADGIATMPGADHAAATAANIGTASAVALRGTDRDAATALLDAQQGLLADTGSDGDAAMVLALARPAPANGILWSVASAGDCAAYLLDRGHVRKIGAGPLGQYPSVYRPDDGRSGTTVRGVRSDEIRHSTVDSFGGRMVLLSDGVDRVLPSDTIARVVREIADAQVCARHLVELSVDHACADNATAVVVDTVHRG